MCAMRSEQTHHLGVAYGGRAEVLTREECHQAAEQQALFHSAGCSAVRGVPSCPKHVTKVLAGMFVVVAPGSVIALLAQGRMQRATPARCVGTRSWRPRHTCSARAASRAVRRVLACSGLRPVGLTRAHPVQAGALRECGATGGQVLS